MLATYILIEHNNITLLQALSVSTDKFPGKSSCVYMLRSDYRISDLAYVFLNWQPVLKLSTLSK